MNTPNQILELLAKPFPLHIQLKLSIHKQTLHPILLPQRHESAMILFVSLQLTFERVQGLISILVWELATTIYT